ncbi:HNH endonuclease [Flavobacterium ponti]|uniref:HNH endonuclease n=1 Tax=Flavobacterium ponti TaxID=665133 RepID=A0ABV9P450_9FLAO
MENFKRIQEEWKEFEIEVRGKVRYAVSNHGRLKSFTTDINQGRIIKGSRVEGFAYLRLKRQKDNKITNYHYGLHKIIAELFIPKDAENQEYVLHLDYDKLNNNINNLKWATYEEMRAHATKSPAVKAAFKKLQAYNLKRDGAKLSSTDVIRLKRKILDPNRKTRLRLIAKEFGISEMQLYRIKTGENWGHIKVEIPNRKEKI